MANHCGSTIFVSYDEQIGVNLTAAQTYNNYMDCHVTFQTSLGKQMKIDVTFIDTEICCDQMTLYDGFYNNGTLLGKCCVHYCKEQHDLLYTRSNSIEPTSLLRMNVRGSIQK